MPLQNRVNPTGEIVINSSRGLYMGNRGKLHNDNKQIISAYKNQCWVTCLLEFKGRKRELMSKNTYTELFFLDEATALSAGHRPCGECRRGRFKEFKEKWLKANSELLEDNKPTISNIDKIIHKQNKTDPKIQKPVSSSCSNSR